MPHSPSRDKVRAHRARLRAQGMRPLQIWVPDTASPDFADAARRQSLAVRSSPLDADDQSFVDSLSAEVLLERDGDDETW